MEAYYQWVLKRKDWQERAEFTGLRIDPTISGSNLDDIMGSTILKFNFQEHCIDQRATNILTVIASILGTQLIQPISMGFRPRSL